MTYYTYQFNTPRGAVARGLYADEETRDLQLTRHLKVYRGKVLMDSVLRDIVEAKNMRAAAETFFT